MKNILRYHYFCTGRMAFQCLVLAFFWPFILLVLPHTSFCQISPDFINVEPYGSVSSVTVDMPAGSAIGDLIIVNIATDDDGAITQPAVFTEIAELWEGGNGPTNGVYYRVITGTEDSSYTFAFPTEPAVVTTLRFSSTDINSSNPIHTSATLTGSSATPTAPSVTTTLPNRTLLQFVAVDAGTVDVLSSNSSTATILGAAESGTSQSCEMMVVSELQPTAGPTPAGTFSFASEQWTSITLALNNSYIDITSPANGQCLSGTTSLVANYEVSSSSGNFELLDPLGTVVATESYATATGTVTFNFTPGLTGNYTVREQSIPDLNDALTIYVDTDGDSVCDLFDMDDDNDGVVDNIESPNCFLSADDVPYESGDRTGIIDVSTDWTINSGSIADILNGDVADNAIRKRNGDFTFNNEVFLHFALEHAVTFDQMIIYHEGAIFLDQDLVGVVQGSNDGATWTDLTVPGSVVLPDGASPHTLNLTQNLGDYSHYRIFVSTGRIDDDEFLREVEFRMVFDPLNYPLSECMDDADSDLFPNHLDLDSDGDGCSDAYEAGATTSLSPNFQFSSASSGANGLPDAVETTPESGTINYTLTYDPDALFSGITGCIDRDGDSVLDANDLDTDNDGILDTIEDGYCDLDYNLLANKQQIQISTNTGTAGSGSIEDLLDGNTTNQTFYYSNSGWTGDEIVRLQFPTPTILTGMEFVIGDDRMMDVGTVLRVQGSNDGSTWEDMSPVAEYIQPSSPQNTPGVLSTTPHAHTILWDNSTPYEYYRLYGVSGGGNTDPWVYELFFRTEAQSICDFDGDGLPNSTDLDSDGDGIPDNIEAQTTTGYVSPNADSPVIYASNNGINSAYLSGLPLPNTDSDIVPDFLDTESDADRIDDMDESGLSLTGIIGNNGLDLGVETSDDYSDVNGIVDDPNTDLAKVTTLDPNEVDYRDKQPPPTITLCHNSGVVNGIGGSFMTYHDDKLLNPNNFGEFGTAYYDIVVEDLGDGQNITAAMLAARGCQIFFFGQSNNGGPYYTGDFSTTALDDLRNWGQSANNVIIAPQGLAMNMGGTELVGGVPTDKYVVSNGNQNPNTLTALGEEVISGAFGQTGSFSQGGSFQGHFTTFPSTACAITIDASDPSLPTGLINSETGDFYFADHGILSELGGMSNSADIINNNDRLFANLIASAARVVIDGPKNVCSFFICSAGEDAPALTSNSISSAGTPIDLSPLYVGTPPTGATLTWHNANPVADENYIGNPTQLTEPGIVYAAFRAADGSCYSPFTSVMVSIDYPDLELMVTPASDTSATGEVQSYIITVTNTGTIPAPDAEVKVPIPAGRQLVLATPSAGTYNESTYIWRVGPLSNGQSATLDITIRVQ